MSNRCTKQEENKSAPENLEQSKQKYTNENRENEANKGNKDPSDTTPTELKCSNMSKYLSNHLHVTKKEVVHALTYTENNSSEETCFSLDSTHINLVLFITFTFFLST